MKDKKKSEDISEFNLILEQVMKGECPSMIGPLAEKAWRARAMIVEALVGAKWLKFEGRSIKTLGFYYHRFRNGGTERVLTQLGSLLAELRDQSGQPKYRVVLISDEPPNEEDYPVSPRVLREELPSHEKSTAKKYALREEKWQEIIAKHAIDVVFYSLWLYPNLIWDLLSIKRSERAPAFVLHAHNTCALMYGMNWLSVKEMQNIYSLADGTVTLSEIDRLYWSRCNSRSVYIPNPCFVKASESRRAKYGKHILWLARISGEKQPLEIPRIMKEVYARDPEIICHVVGAYDVNLQKKLEKRIVAEGLTENVIMEGFHVDVTPYYECCSLFLLTSRYEGFTLTLYEAAAHGLPTVMYEMPWLAYNELIEGAISVPQLDAEAAAEAIVKLVNDPDEWQRRSDAIYDSACRYEEMDITTCWTSLIESLEKGVMPNALRFDRRIEVLLNEIDDFRDSALKLSARDERDKSQLNFELDYTRDSTFFRLGRSITWLPRKLRGGVRCWKENGGKYTFYRVLYHLHIRDE